MKWIPLRERKPIEPLDENVIFCNSDGIVCVHCFGSGKIPENATHWLELPTLPKPEKLIKEFYGMKAEIKGNLCHFEDGTIVDLSQPIEDS